MSRTTRNDLRELVGILNIRTENKYDFSLGIANGGYRLERAAESVDVSPRLRAGELALYIRAMLAGHDLATIEGMRK